MLLLSYIQVLSLFFKDIFDFKVFIELLPYWIHFLFWFFGCEACGILTLWPGFEPTPLKLEGEVLTSGPPGKPLFRFSLNTIIIFSLASLGS